MAVYSTFFVAKPQDVIEGFPGWKLPLVKPVRRELRNPFTGQVTSIESSEPDWTDEDEEPWDPQHQALAVEGHYQDYLEGRLPSFIALQPHWTSKGLTDIECAPLLRAVGTTGKLRSALFAPPSADAALMEFPSEFISQVCAANPSELARSWAAAMSAPEHTHSATGIRIRDGWTADDATQVLNPLIALASQANPDQRMYLLIEA